jgi:PAS domain S-box-containing protein
MMPTLGIRARLLVLLIGIGLVPLALVSLLLLERAQEALSTQAFAQLQTIRDTKKTQVRRYFAENRSDITVLAGTPHIGAALDAFASTLNQGVLDRAQYDYFESLEYGDGFRGFITEHGHYDLMLITPEGDIVYSVRGESDLTRNVLAEPLAETPLGRAFRLGLKRIVHTDFSVYEPAGGKLISFLLAPISSFGQTLGMVVLKTTPREINEIMRERSGMVESGEAYLVGPDFLMRSDAYLDPENRTVAASFANPGKGAVKTEASRRALAGEAGQAVLPDYRDIPVLSAYTPVFLEHGTYALIAETNETDAFAPIHELQQLMWLVGVGLLLLVLITASIIATLVTRPIILLSDASIEIAAGNLEREVAAKGTHELGILSDNFNRMRLSIRDKLQQIQEKSAELDRINEGLEEQVTQRTRDLEESQARFELAVRGSGDALWEYDSRSGENWFSPRFIELLGYDTDELSPTLETWKEHVHPDDAEHAIATFAAHLERDAPYDIEYRMRTKSGDYVWFQARAKSLRDSHGRPLRTSGSVGDITERKGMETELKGRIDELGDARRAGLNMMLDLEQERKSADEMREKAESATRAKSSFLAAMSHEIRTPMNGVVGMIDLLRQTKLNADQSQMMRTVRDSAFSLLQIINDILDFSKIEAGKLAVETVPTSVRDVVEGVAETLLPNATPKDIRLLIFIDPEIPSWVMSDQVRLRQILFNIAGNAVKFTESTADRKGVVTIRADLAPGDSEKNIEVRFSISDNGIGMSGTAVSDLFTPFTQAESSTTRRFGGTGLGLSICKNLTEIMNGEIAVESTEGEGSTFTVTLPLRVADKEPDIDDTHDLSGLHILAAVREQSAREIIGAYLSHHGAGTEVTYDIDALEGLVLAAREKGKPFDIVVIGSAWDFKTQKNLIEALRKKTDGLRFVPLTGDRTARKGMIVPDMVVIETNPLKRSSFVRGIAMAAGRASPDVNMAEGTAALKKRIPTVEEARAMGQLILVAEDNITNQDVIKRQLGVLGHACEIADDGRQALEAWKNGRYAILLTDCHMPEMDGYQLTGAIREAEKMAGAEAPRIPIIAITANALQGEGDRCLESGMDDYLAKPLEMDRLKRTLAKWMPATAVEADLEEPEVEEKIEASPAAEGAEGAAIDERALKDVFGDDEETFKEILQDFVEPCEQIVGEIMAAYAARDAAAIGASGHKLKSSSGSIGAHALSRLCADLEKAGKGGDWEGIERNIPLLEDTMKAVIAYIGAL